MDGIISNISAQLQQEKKNLGTAQVFLQDTNKKYGSSFLGQQERIVALKEELFVTKLDKIIHVSVWINKQRTRLRQTLLLEEGTNLFDYFKVYCLT